MKMLEAIRKRLRRSSVWGSQPVAITAASTASPNGPDSRIDDPGCPLTLQEGMSAGTARLIIDRYCGTDLMGQSEVSGPENRGRYFRVRLSEPDGRVTRELLVDKQSGQVICSQVCPDR
jgi:hypothetical protein